MTDNSSEQQSQSQNISVTDAGEGQIQIEGELTAEKMADARKRTLDNLRENADIDGFRKGAAPDDVLVNQYGEMTVLQQAAELALNEEYPTILREQQISAIGQPQVSITKLQPGEPLGFQIQTATMPEVTLPDYKQIAKDELAKEENQMGEIEVTDQEVEDVITQVRRNAAAQQQSGQDGTSTGSAQATQDPSSIPEDQLPEINDAFVQMMGFESMEAFRKQIRDNIRQEKLNKEHQRRQLAVIDALIEQSDITLPEVVVNSELEKMMAQLKEDIQRAGYSYEQYLEQVGKSDEQIREEWRPQAVKKAKTQLILNKIATEEGITPDADQVNQQVEQIMQQHQDANREQAKVFVETQLMNQEVAQMLENQDPNADTQQVNEAGDDQTGEDSPHESNDSQAETETGQASEQDSADGQQPDETEESKQKES